MRMQVRFTFDGIIGAETIEVVSTRIDAYNAAIEIFWRRVDDSGARIIEGARSAWDCVPIYHGPLVLTVGPV